MKNGLEGSGPTVLAGTPIPNGIGLAGIGPVDIGLDPNPMGDVEKSLMPAPVVIGTGGGTAP